MLLDCASRYQIGRQNCGFWKASWAVSAGDKNTAGSGGEKNRRHEEAILALLEHPTLERAAAALNVSSTTLWRWMQDREFKNAYREARRRAFSQSIGRLQQASTAAVSTLLKVMIDPNTPASTRVRAADSVLDHAAKALELEDIEARVAELERAAEASKDNRR